MKILVFGSAFDMPHKGHEDIIRQVKEEYDLILLVPSFKHAFDKQMKPYEHRLSMTKAFCRDLIDLNIEVSDIERTLGENGEPIYSIELLNALSDIYPDASLTILYGPDNIENLHKFHRYQEILQHYHIASGIERKAIRSSTLRKKIENGNDEEYVKDSLTPSVYKMINCYRSQNNNIQFFPVYIDAVIFRFFDNNIQVRLKKRSSSDPRLPSVTALEGVLMTPSKDKNEIDALNRLFSEKIGLKYSYCEQLSCHANSKRDPSGFSMVIPYLCLVETTANDDDATWVNVNEIRSKSDNYLAFDHMLLINRAYEAMINKSSYSDLPLFLLEEPFRFSDIRKVMQVTMGKEPHRGVLNNRIIPLLDCVGVDETRKRDNQLYKKKTNNVNYLKVVSEGMK